MQILASQPTYSSLKKKGTGLKAEFARMHLAVYPFEVEFLSNIQYKTLFHFQKNYQIIGEINSLIPCGEKGYKYELRDINNIINFKLYSATNVVYKWSVYRKYLNGEEEYLQSCTLNLKEIVNSYMIPQKNFGEHSNNSLLELTFNAKQMRLKFPKTGLILMFMLFVSDDPRHFRQYVEGKMLKIYQDNVLENIPPLAMLRAESNFDLIDLSSRKNQNSNYSLEDLDKKLGNRKISNQSVPSGQKIKEYLEKNNSQQKNEGGDSTQQIMNIINSFDPNAAENLSLSEDVHEKKVQKQLNQQIKKEEVVEQNKTQQQNVEAEKKPQTRDYGMLKLESDQGRVMQDPIDRKLQLEELQAIDQQYTSKGDTYQSQNMTPLKSRANKTNKKSLSRKQSTKQIKEESYVAESKFNIRKIVIIGLAAIFLFLIAVTLSKSVTKKKKSSGKQKR